MKHLLPFLWLCAIFLWGCAPNQAALNSGLTVSPTVVFTTPSPSPTITPTTTPLPSLIPSATPTATRTPTPTPTLSVIQPDGLYLLTAPYSADHPLIPAPQLEGLIAKASQDGLRVEYLDPKGRTIVSASAYFAGSDSPSNQRLLKMLKDIYGEENAYVVAQTFPRFRYAIDGIQAGFFALDRNLTYNQVILLKETLELFNRPVFEGLKADMFAETKAYVMLDRIEGSVAGVNYVGTGVIGIDRRDLFGNKYELASVLAHEAAHVLQGAPTNDSCADRLRREVGDQTIPVGFNTWDAGTLLQAIKAHQIGAYHVSLWVYYQLRLPNTTWFEYVIQTGYAGSALVVNCKP